MKPGLLASLLQDTNLLAQRVARLKELLPHTNVSAMASKLPEILLQVKLAPRLYKPELPASPLPWPYSCLGSYCR